MFQKIQALLEKYIAPLAEKINGSDTIKALSRGMMYTMPITLGVCILAILVNLPIPAWSAFLSSTGLSGVCNEVLTVTMNMLALYIVISIAYNNGKQKGINGITTAVVTLGVFLVLMPLVVNVEGRSTTYLINTAYLGSKGIFVAILLGMIVSNIYVFLMKKMSIKLPDSVPTMVTDSLSPTFVAIIIFTVAFLIKWALSLTAFNNLFDLINQLLATPIMNVGSSPWAIIIAYTFSNLLWFFGVHPSAVMNVFSPAISFCLLGNLEAYMAGTPVAELPNLAFVTIYAAMSLGGSGNLIGLAISMLTAKSERYKSLAKISTVPCLFNISEPMMFGVPVVLNPIFLIPMVLSTPICSLVAWGLCKLGFANSINPAVMAPWVMPKFISGFMSGGVKLLAVVLICTVISVVLYYPFFKVADNEALKEETENA